MVEYRTKDDVNEIVELLCKLNQSNYEYICIIISQFLLTQKGEEQDFLFVKPRIILAGYFLLDCACPACYNLRYKEVRKWLILKK